MSTNNPENLPTETDYARTRRSEGVNMYIHLAEQARAEVERQTAEVAALAKEIDEDAANYVANLGIEQAVNLRERMNSDSPFHAYFLLSDGTSQEMHAAFITEAQLPVIDLESSDLSLEVIDFSFENTTNKVNRRIELDEASEEYSVHYRLVLESATLPQ